MELDIVEGLEQLKPEMNKYANSLCKALRLSVAEVDEIVQRTMIAVWKISQRDGNNKSYDKRRRAGKRTKGNNAPSGYEVSQLPEFEGEAEYKQWIFTIIRIQAKRLAHEHLAIQEVYDENLEERSSDELPARPIAIPRYDWE